MSTVFFLLNSANLKSLKDQIRTRFNIGSSHLDQGLAAALGFSTYAALLAHRKDINHRSQWLELDSDRFRARMARLPKQSDIQADGRVGVDFRAFGSPILRVQDDEPSFSSPWYGVVFMALSVDHKRFLAMSPLPRSPALIDYESLRIGLQVAFANHVPVRVSVPTGFVDGLTRILFSPSDAMFDDLSAQLLHQARIQKTPILDVPHQALVIIDGGLPKYIPFVIEAESAEAGFEWCYANDRYLRRRDETEMFQYSYVPDYLHKVLERSFNLPFKAICNLSIEAWDRLPDAELHHLVKTWKRQIRVGVDGFIPE